MYLKRIELHGFKSFGRRVSLDLDPTLNAIVGPNGCGKSNLLDAVRWALGESNLRALRGGRTQDIVFSGTRELRPLGFAEVTLTFDNSDGTLPLPSAEVAITRRAYRSGQSLFAINGVPCRLRDVHELLSRAGFGNRRHALVGQGEADELVLGPGEQRRAALEEVAGVARFRHLAGVARLLRDRARQDLERLGAALGEMGRHVAFLERQAARAREARQLGGQLAGLRWELARRSWEAARAEAARAQQERDRAASALAEVRARLSQGRQQVEAQLALHGELSGRQEALARQAQELERQLLERRHELVRASDREFEAAGRLQQAEADRQRLEQRLQRCRQELAEADELEASEQRALEASEQALAELQAGLEESAGRIDQRERELQARREELLGALEALSRVRNELMACERELTAAEAEQARCQQQAEALTVQEQELSRQRQELGEQLTQAQAALQALQARREQALGELAALRPQLAEAEAELGRLAAQHERALREMRLLEQARRDLEGYSRGVRALQEGEGPWRRQVLGPLGQLVRVPEGLEIAVAAALGNYLEAVVIETADAAAAAIEYLRQGRRGWVTFLPLDFVRPRPLVAAVRQRLAQQPGFIGLVSELVAVPEPVRPALEYVGSRVAVVEELSQAIAMGRAHPELARIVTRSGETVVPGGPVSGGMREHSRAEQLVRARRLEELAREVARLRGELEVLSARRHQLAGRAGELEQLCRQLEQELQATEARLQRLRLGREGLEARLQELQGREALVLSQRERLSREVDELCERRRRLQEELGRLGQQEQNWRAALQALGEELSAARTRRRELEARLLQVQAAAERQRARLELVRGRRQQLMAEQERLLAELARLDEQKQAAEQEMGQARELGGRLQQEVQALQQRLKALQEEQQQQAARLASLTEQLPSARQAVAELERAEEVASATLVKAERAWQQAAVRLSEAQRQLHEARLALEQLGGFPGEAPAEGEGPGQGQSAWAELSTGALRQQEAQLQARLAALGPVDLAAIDAYEQARQSYRQAVADRDDVAEALERAERLQEQLEGLCARQLVRAAEQASQAFDALCRRLFAGGEGRLTLEGERPLEGRVALEVCPPSKRPQPALALSGGERALVAAAFVFALQAVRPSPVCVMDELDAALDEVNLERLVQVLVEFSRTRQIILITHRQRTMEAASALFGVTMDETGVSRLVPLRLQDVAVGAGA